MKEIDKAHIKKRKQILRPCQHCGEDVDWIVYDDDGVEFAQAYAVQCRECGQMNWEKDKSEARYIG